MTTSPSQRQPTPPWSASVACRKCAGVPVLDSVAAILAPTIPDLPIPVTTTRPVMSSRIDSGVDGSVEARLEGLDGRAGRCRSTALPGGEGRGSTAISARRA